MPRSSSARRASRARADNASETAPLLSAGPATGLAVEWQHPSNYGLRRVSGPIPPSVILILAMELCERAAFWGLAGPLQNYIGNKPGDPLHHGALGFGQATATRLSFGFNILCYLAPIPGAIVADQYLGRYKTIRYSSLVYIIGLCVLFVTSIPYYRSRHMGLAGLIVALVLIAIGTGGIKSALGAWVADQFPEDEPPKVITTDIRQPDGRGTERVVVDRQMALARAFLFYYAVTQVGSFLNLLTTMVELRHGFPSAFFIPLPIIVVGFLLLLLKNRSIIQVPPQNSPLLSYLKTRFQRQRQRPSAPSPSSSSGDVKQALSASKIFLFFPLYTACQLQVSTNFLSQAGTLEPHGVSNNLLASLNPLTVIVFAPLLDSLIFPFLHRHRARPGPITRMAIGFLCISAAMAYAAVLQSTIYQAKTQPEYDCPGQGGCRDGSVPNHTHIGAQTPLYILTGISEVFIMPAGLEWAATRAPPSMRSLVVALYMLTFASGAALSIGIAQLAKNPSLAVMYCILSAVSGVAGLLFWGLFKGDGRNKATV